MAKKKKKEVMPMVSIPADVYEFMTRTMLGLYCSYGYEVKPGYETIMEDAREVFKRTKQLESKEFREWHCKKRYNESSEYFAFLGVKLGEYINDHHNGHSLLLKTYETGSEDDEYEHSHHGNLMHEKYDDPYPEYQELLQQIHNGNQMEKYMTEEMIAQRDKKAQEGYEEWLAMDKDDYQPEWEFKNDLERDEAGIEAIIGVEFGEEYKLWLHMQPDDYTPEEKTDFERHDKCVWEIYKDVDNYYDKREEIAGDHVWNDYTPELERNRMKNNG